MSSDVRISIYMDTNPPELVQVRIEDWTIAFNVLGVEITVLGGYVDESSPEKLVIKFQEIPQFTVYEPVEPGNKDALECLLEFARGAPYVIV